MDATARDAGSLPPLFVDLDGTLVHTDTLYESALAAARREPIVLLQAAAALLRGRAKLKQLLAERGMPDIATLPYNTELCGMLAAQRDAGRRLHLATAADRAIGERVAAHLGLFDSVIASDGIRNLKGRAKLAAIRAAAPDGFAYAGNGREDLPIWQAARSAIVVNAPAAVERRVRSDTVAVERVIAPRRRRGAALLSALRPRQWVKNVLVFVPLLTSFQFAHADAVLHAALAFVAFCLCASATYVFNDLLDLESDRAHPRKRARPFAAGTASIPTGVALGLALFAGGLVLAAAGSLLLLAVLALYCAATTAYSLALKRYVLLDAVTLALLYTLRILAGAVAIGVAVSEWLLGFSLFVFLSLALIKRCGELVALGSQPGTSVRGRDYREIDLRVLWPLGVATAACSVVVFALFVSAPEVRSRYATPALLWLIAVALVYWLGRLWIKTARGEMTDDPIVFALRDFGSLLVIAGSVVVALLARFVRI